MEIQTIADLRSANKQAGMHWFSPATMRFFKSKVASRLRSGDGKTGYFVTSERQSETRPRLFTIRKADLVTADIDTVGEFQGYATRRAAMAGMDVLVKADAYVWMGKNKGGS